MLVSVNPLTMLLKSEVILNKSNIHFKYILLSIYLLKVQKN